MYKLFGSNPLLFAKEKQRKHSSDPLIQTNILTYNIFVCLLSLLPLFQTMNSPCNVRRKFHFYTKSHGTGSSGKELEVKISFYRVNSEIWSIRVIQWLVERPCLLLPCPFYLNVIKGSSAFYHLLPPFSAAQVLGDVNISSFLFNHCVSDYLSLCNSLGPLIIVTTLVI